MFHSIVLVCYVKVCLELEITRCACVFFCWELQQLAGRGPTARRWKNHFKCLSNSTTSDLAGVFSLSLQYLTSSCE